MPAVAGTAVAAAVSCMAWAQHVQAVASEQEEHILVVEDVAVAAVVLATVSEAPSQSWETVFCAPERVSATVDAH